MKTNATQRSLDYLQKHGWLACKVEKWVPVAGDWKQGKRIDAFGFGDLLACRTFLRAGTVVRETALVQCFPTSGWKSHVDKINGVPLDDSEQAKVDAHYVKTAAGLWLAAGNLILFHGWSLRSERDAEGKLVKTAKGESRKRWTLREERVSV